MKKTIAIVGSHPATRAKFDFNRTDCDVWVFNEAMSTEWAKRADAVFQLHIPTIFRNPNNRNDPRHYAWLKSGNTPIIYMQEKYEDVPNSVEFPKDEILTMLPNAKVNDVLIREVMSTPSWALAYAIYLKYEHIEVYGIELDSNTEYSYQQGNFKYWVGVAAGRGIDITIHSTMFNAPLYGYEGEVFIEYDEFEKRVSELQPSLYEKDAEFVSAFHALAGVSETLISDDNKNEVIDNVQKVINATAVSGEVEGRILENIRYQEKADEMKKQGGDFVFSRQEFEHAAAYRNKEIDEKKTQIDALKGQLDIYHSSVALSARNSPKRRKLLDAYKYKQIELIRLNKELGVLYGAKDESIRYMKRLDAGIKAAGGEKSEEAILAQL